MLCRLILDILGSPNCNPAFGKSRGAIARGSGGVEQHVHSYTKFCPKFVEDLQCCTPGVIE